MIKMVDTNRNKINPGMKIGKVKVLNKTVLAPMAAVNCTAFRIMCRSYGAGLLFTQMYQVSVVLEKLEEEGKAGVKTGLKEFLNIRKEESPIAIQLIGSVKDNWEKALKAVEKYADIIDINFHCHDDFFVKHKMGVYLLEHIDQMESIAKRCVKSTSKPVTAKIRSGVDEKSLDAVRISMMLEKTGIAAIFLHPRTVKQKYGGKADWSIIKQVKNAVSIPVIGNGDIVLPGNAKAMIEQTKCDGVMIGREAMRNPPIFDYVNYILEHGKNKPKKEKDARKLILEFIELYKKYENRESINELHDHCTWLLSHVKGAPRIKKKIRKANALKEIIDILLH